MLDQLEITISRTSNGQADYVQIASPAAVPVNIVLIADRIVVNDTRVDQERNEPANDQ